MFVPPQAHFCGLQLLITHHSSIVFTRLPPHLLVSGIIEQSNSLATIQNRKSKIGNPKSEKETMYSPTLIEPGDQWELDAAPDVLAQGTLPLNPALSNLFTAGDIHLVADTPKGTVPIAYDANTNALHGDPLRTLTREAGTLRLECVADNPLTLNLRLITTRDLHVPSESVTSEEGVPLTFEPTDTEFLQHEPQLRTDLRHFNLALEAIQFGMVAGFDELICLPLMRDVELLEHQLRTTRMVLRRLRGRALLCDEVGLGKTIEASMILLELVARGLVRRTLVLTPPSLVEQWQNELRRKFSLDSITHDDPTFREQGKEAWGQHERIIASYHTAKREPHRSAILAHEWDMVIIDEVHHFRNANTQLWKFAAELRKKYVLLLTATPVQNNLEELFNLVTLLQPGLLSTSRSFQRQFVDRKDKQTPRNIEQLHELLAEVMVRNRRSTVGLTLTHRVARTEMVQFSAEERTLYDRVSRFVRSHLHQGSGTRMLNRMTLLTLQKVLGSSSHAATPMLERLAQDDRLAKDLQQPLAELAALAQQITQSSKIAHLRELLATFPDKVVIFTQFRDTQEKLGEQLLAAGESVVLFHGSLSRMQKEAAIQEFRGPARILISTDSGSEGRNLQFCNVIVNFDLPWNPMKIEQRIGRLSRIGQQRDVHVINLVAQDTLESAMLYLLDAKIAMFELVIGEIDMILGNLNENQEFEEMVAELWVQTKDEQDFQQAMEQLGERLVAAKQHYLQQRAYEDKLFGEHFAPEQ
jgi:SNF2 family DNA or RNA helicase